MRTKHFSRHRRYVLALLLGLLAGCTASASVRSSASSDFESDHEKRSTRSSGSELRETKAQASGSALSRDTAGSSVSSGAPAAEVSRPSDNDAAAATGKPVEPARSGTEHDRGDHDRGHGNDADRVDEDNPGKSKKK